MSRNLDCIFSSYWRHLWKLWILLGSSEDCCVFVWFSLVVNLAEVRLRTLSFLQRAPQSLVSSSAARHLRCAWGCSGSEWALTASGPAEALVASLPPPLAQLLGLSQPDIGFFVWKAVMVCFSSPRAQTFCSKAKTTKQKTKTVKMALCVGGLSRAPPVLMIPRGGGVSGLSH